MTRTDDDPFGARGGVEVAARPTGRATEVGRAPLVAPLVDSCCVCVDTAPERGVRVGDPGLRPSLTRLLGFDGEGTMAFDSRFGGLTSLAHTIHQVSTT
jgi:hypothetical protein